MASVEFIEVEFYLPVLGRLVEVKGDYVPPNTGYPKAYLRKENGTVFWDSTEWRGMVAITHWRPLAIN